MMARHKFNAVAVRDDNHHFPSKIEFAYNQHLKMLQKMGEVIFFLRQVPFHLPGGAKYVVDYQVFCSNGTVRFTDVKGCDTLLSKTKRKMVEAIYPVEIEIIRKGDF